MELNGLTIEEFAELAKYIQEHNSWDNLYDSVNSGCPVPKYYNVNMRIDTRDGQIWKIEFDTLTNCKEEKVTFTDAKEDMKGRIYKWLQTPTNKKHSKKAGNR